MNMGTLYRVEWKVTSSVCNELSQKWVEWNGILPSQPKQVVQRLLMEGRRAIEPCKWLEIELSGK